MKLWLLSFILLSVLLLASLQWEYSYSAAPTLQKKNPNPNPNQTLFLTALNVPTVKLKVLAPVKSIENLRSDIVKLIYDFTPEPDMFLAIAECESNLNPLSRNDNDRKVTGKPSLGLLQINSNEDWNWQDPKTNIERAVIIYKKQGWRAWKNCAKMLNLI